MQDRARHTLYAFGLTWLGQVVSRIGTGLSFFGLGVEVYRASGSVTTYAILSLFYMLPPIVLSPFAGVLVDRWDRRQVMLLSDLFAMLSPLWILILLSGEEGSGALGAAPWRFYAPTALAAACDAFRWPAYQATIPLLVSEKNLGRANGLIELGFGSAQIVSPIIAAMMLLKVGLRWVLLADLASFVFAVLTLLMVQFPRTPISATQRAIIGAMRHEIRLGWEFVRRRHGLFGLLWLVSGVSLCSNLAMILITPLCLSFTDVAALGRIRSIAGLGMLFGGVAMSVWGGPQRRMRGVLGFALLSSALLIVASRPLSVPLFTATAFAYLCSLPCLHGCANTIWQNKVPLELQGRVFSVRRLLSGLAGAVAMLAAGPLAEHLFEPWLAPGGALAGSVGRLLGTGQGRGIGFLFLVLGILTGMAVLAAYRSPAIRNLEVEQTDPIPPPPGRPGAGYRPA